MYAWDLIPYIQSIKPRTQAPTHPATAKCVPVGASCVASACCFCCSGGQQPRPCRTLICSSSAEVAAAAAALRRSATCRVASSPSSVRGPRRLSTSASMRLICRTLNSCLSFWLGMHSGGQHAGRLARGQAACAGYVARRARRQRRHARMQLWPCS